MDIVVGPFLDHDFMRQILLAGALTVVTTSLVGTWVVLRGLTFMGDAMAHGVLPGIAVATVTGSDPTLGAAISGLAMVGGIGWVNRRTRLGADVGIGLLFVGMLALGVAIVSASGSYATDLSTILFGDVLGVSSGDIVVATVAAVVALAATVVGYRALLTLTFSEDKAAVLGFRPGLVHILMLVLTAMAVVSSFRTVGTLLVFALLVAPPAAGALVSRRVPWMMVASMAYGLVAVVVGLLVSYHADIAAGPAIAVVAVVGFFLTLVVSDLREGARARAASGQGFG